MFRKLNNNLTAFLQLWWKNPRKSKPMSPIAAKSIQKRACRFVNNISDQALTPPYVLIASQLSDPKEPIFQMAVYYLCTIAVLTPKYKQPIISILKAYARDHLENTSRVSYLNQMIEKNNLS